MSLSLAALTLASALTVFTCQDSSMTNCHEKVTRYETDEDCALAAATVLTQAKLQNSPYTVVAYCSADINDRDTLENWEF